MKNLIKGFMIILIFNLFLSNFSYGFVAGPSSVSEGEKFLNLQLQQERGKIEPNENKNSFQNAQIDLMKIKYVQGLSGSDYFSRSNVYFEYADFSSGEEKVGSNLFYEKDTGRYLTLGFSGDLMHDLQKQFGVFFQFTPYSKYNRNKFSNPRIDLYAFGFNSSFHITDNVFQKNLIHIGSGDSNHQNAYFAADIGFGYKLNQLVKRQFTLTSSLFFEADTSERKDPKYDSIFSPAGTEDRIRSFKYGILIGIDIELVEKMNLVLTSLSKLGGYDARSTQILNFGLGYKF